MTKQRIERKIINPAMPQELPQFFSAIKTFNLIKEYQLIACDNVPVELLFTYPVFRLQKPARISLKNGLPKLAAEYAVVYKPEALGTGAFGSVYPVLGVWKWTSANDKPEFKIKNDPLKRRVVKSNINADIDSLTPKHIIQSYKEEQFYGRYVEHMSYKYPVCVYKNFGFLLMREQPGMPLSKLLEQLHQNPSLLTAVQRLILTINLIKASDEQVSDIHSDENRSSYLIHNDIKPSNIMVDDQMNVHFIDYGLAQFSEDNREPCGTPSYLDPEIIDNLIHIKSKDTDFSSLSYVIAEVWGDETPVPHSMSELRERNKRNPLTNLLVKIKDMNLADKARLNKAIHSITSYRQSGRLSKAETLDVVERILTKYTAKPLRSAEKILAHMPGQELITLLKGPRGSDFIAQLGKKPALMTALVNKLNYQLLDLDAKTIAQLKAQGLSYAKSDLLNEGLRLKLFSAKNVQTLIQLDAPLDSDLFKYWLRSPAPPGEEKEWATMCRIMYRALPNAAKILEQTNHASEFNSIFCKHFITLPDPYDEDLPVRLIKRHFEIRQCQKRFLELADCIIPNTALLGLINEMISAQANQLLLALPKELTSLQKMMNTLYRVLNCVYAMNPYQNFPTRSHAIYVFKQDVGHFINQAQGPINTSELSRLNKVCDFLNTMEVFLMQLKNALPQKNMDQISEFFDVYYERQDHPLESLKSNVNKLCLAFNEIKLTENAIQQIADYGFFTKDQFIMLDAFNELKQHCSLLNSDVYLTKVHAFYTTFTMIAERFLVEEVIESKRPAVSYSRDRLFKPAQAALTRSRLEAADRDAYLEY